MAKQKKNSDLKIDENQMINHQPENKGEDIPLANQNRDNVGNFDIDYIKQQASDDRKKVRIKNSYILLIVIISLIMLICVGQAIIEITFNKTVAILDNVNVFLQYAVTTILGYLFATKMDD